MAPPILILRDIDLTFGGVPLLEGAELSVSARDRLCLVGRNGSGKSTLLKIAAGLLEADHGEVFQQPGTHVRYLPQEPDLTGFATTGDYVEAGMGPNDDAHRGRYLLEQLGLDGSEDPATLSGGEARRAALARVLAPEPDILLLDEPTNHLDLPAIEWLENELKGVRSALVLISHDRRFLENLSRATVWLSQGGAKRLDKGFADFEAWRDDIVEQEKLDRHKLDRKIVAENHWLVHGVSARRKRNQGRLRALHDLREQRRNQRQITASVKMNLSEGEVSGKLVGEAKDLSKSYDGVVIVDQFSTRIQRGDRIGLVGPNGAGKTTLLNMLTGALEPDRGTMRLGVNLEMVTLDQRRESLDPNWTLGDALTGGSGDNVTVGGIPWHVVSYMKDFLFTPNQVKTPINALSGGERGRLMLARAFARPSNLLVLDEPTNDLDLETLDLLQEMLANYAGTVLLVSHDRDFLDRVVTSVIVSEGQGRWQEYAGGYSDMIIQQGILPNVEKSLQPAKTAKPVVRSSKPDQKRKLSYKEKYALENLPTQIETLESEIEELHQQLAEPSFFANDPESFKRSADKLKNAEIELAAAEEQWLTLELLKGELEEK
ncbi:MAG: ATP-binding cassette domain-containing protein [Rhodospirillaceae bacterium]|nr:ATP-binding cassette domain-containing protein [Rhodospirillaceae bacterium]